MNLGVNTERYNIELFVQDSDTKTNCKLNIPWCVSLCCVTKSMLCGAAMPNVVVSGICGFMGAKIFLDCLPDTGRVAVIASDEVVIRQPEVNREHID